MAHPLLVAENAVRLFITQWLGGLTPSLRLLTKPDGTIYATSEVSSFPQIVNLPRCRRRRSGLNSRLRRRRDRSDRNHKLVTKSDHSLLETHASQPPTTSIEPRLNILSTPLQTRTRITLPLRNLLRWISHRKNLLINQFS